MAAGDRDFRVFLAILKYLGEKRDPFTYIQTQDLVELFPPERQAADARRNMRVMYSYVKFLEEIGYVKLGTPTLDANCTVALTALGEMFLQPELAQLQNPDLLSEMLEAVENQILTYPMDDADRNGFLFKFREALARKAPELAIQLLFEFLKYKAGL